MNRVYDWDNDKNYLLKQSRDICFEEIVIRIEEGDEVDMIQHPNQNKYPGQGISLVKVNDYVYMVPFIVEEDGTYFLKTIIPSRKMTKKYLRGSNEEV